MTLFFSSSAFLGETRSLPGLQVSLYSGFPKSVFLALVSPLTPGHSKLPNESEKCLTITSDSRGPTPHPSLTAGLSLNGPTLLAPPLCHIVLLRPHPRGERAAPSFCSLLRVPALCSHLRGRPSLSSSLSPGLLQRPLHLSLTSLQPISSHLTALSNQFILLNVCTPC